MFSNNYNYSIYVPTFTTAKGKPKKERSWHLAGAPHNTFSASLPIISCFR